MAHIRVEDLWFGYNPDQPVLNGINLEIAPGEFVALIGQNGAGKSTLAKHLNGIHRPQRGRVLLDGLPVGDRSLAVLAGEVGYCYQNPDHQIFHPTIYEEVAFGPRNLGLTPPQVEERVREALEAVGLWAERQEPPYFAGKGERQRVAVASILAMSPGVIVLDEPTTGLDWAGAREMMTLVTRLHVAGRTIIMITHDMRLVADYAARVVVLGEGRVLLDGTPAAVFSQADVLHATALKPPQITRLAAVLRPDALRAGALRPGAPPALSVAELAAQLVVTSGGQAASATGAPAPSAGTAVAPAPAAAPPAGTAPAPAAAPPAGTAVAPATGPAGRPRTGLHPTARFLTAVALILLPFTFQAPAILALIFLVQVAAAYLLGLPRAGWRVWRVLGAIGGGITFLTWLPFVPEGRPLVSGIIPGLGWHVGITGTGLIWATGMGLRIASVALASLTYVTTTPPRQITAGLLGLKLPYPVAYLISLAFRLLPMSQRDAALIREVQAVRGLNMEEGSFLTRARRFTALLGPLVLLALRRVQLIANALDSRGFRLRGSRHRLYRMPRWQRAEIGLVLLVMAVLAASIWLRVRGFGVVLPGRL